MPWVCGRATRSRTCRFNFAAATGRWAKKCRDGFLRAIAGEPDPDSGGQSGRLQLAEWLTQPDHPLTSRVMANRIWRWHFGRGIVPSVDNFGRLGETPTNQPLLDWLALRFVDKGWSIKEMHRLIMLSSTYQMGSDYDRERGGGGPGEHAALARQPASASKLRRSATRSPR